MDECEKVLGLVLQFVPGQSWLCCIMQAIRKERFEKAIESETPTRKSMSADDIQVGFVDEK